MNKWDDFRVPLFLETDIYNWVVFHLPKKQHKTEDFGHCSPGICPICLCHVARGSYGKVYELYTGNKHV